MAIGRLEYRAPEAVARLVSLPPRPTMLAGREPFLVGLDARLWGGEGRSPRVVAMYGLAGVGKTSVAVEYAHRNLDSAGVVWLFPAEDPAVLAAGFASLAAHLGAGGDLVDDRDLVASVHGVLADGPVPWLLIFDNARDQESVRAFLPPAGNGRALITSQSALWPPGQALEVPVLDQEAAAEFLTARTGDPDEHAAGELAAELGGLPLALEQTGAYIDATGGSLAGYLADFRERRADLLARGEPAGYGRTVTATWALAFGRLGQASPPAVGLLRLLACCAPAPVPLALLLPSQPGIQDRLGADVLPVLRPLLGDPLAAADAVAALRRYSLVTLAGHGLVLVHRLVQAAALDQMPEELAVQWRQASAVLIEAAIPADAALPGAWPAFEALLPHAQVALADDSDGMARIASYLGLSGSHTAARDLQQKIASAREKVSGLEHPDTLKARASLAYWTGEAEDPVVARDQLAALLPTLERVLGPEHPETLAARHNLARFTGEAGDPAVARDQFAALLPVLGPVLGPEHPETLTAAGNLAYWAGEAGDPAAARDQFAALLPALERALGPEHPDTVTIRHNLAYWAGQATGRLARGFPPGVARRP